jgi:hypothetical protein
MSRILLGNIKGPAGNADDGSALAAETTRAEAAESTIAASVTTETTRAEAAEATKVNRSGDAMTGKLAPKVVALTDGATIAIDASAGNVQDVTLGGNRTIAAPTNAVDGQTLMLRITQDGTGSRTLTWNSVFDFASIGTPELSTTAGKTDVVPFIYIAAATKWRCLGVGLG